MKELLCKKGNEFFKQGKSYPIVKEYLDGFYKVKAEDVFYSHIASNDLTDNQPKSQQKSQKKVLLLKQSTTL